MAKLLFDLFPLLIFFAAFKFYDIYVATAAAILATLAQVVAFYWRERRFQTTHLITLGVIAVFGGLTIALRDDAFIKWKPSIVNWAFSAIIVAMLFTRKTAMEYLMGGQLHLPRSVWRGVNIAWAAFFLFLGLLNLYVAFGYNLDAPLEVRTKTWVNFKVFGMFGLTIVFAVVQTMCIVKYLKPQNE